MGHAGSSRPLWFRTPFPGERINDERYRDAAFFRSAGEPFAAYWAQLPVRSESIVAWVGGPKVAALAGISKTDVIERAVNGFGSMLGNRSLARDELEEGFTHDWGADPFARGTYSYVAVGGSGARAALAVPLDGTLFFAGEADVAQRSRRHGKWRARDRHAGRRRGRDDARRDRSGFVKWLRRPAVSAHGVVEELLRVTMTGSSAAALTGLMFVVITLVTGQDHTGSRDEGINTFSTPTVMHFCAALLISAILSARLALVDTGRHAGRTGRPVWRRVHPAGDVSDAAAVSLSSRTLKT